MANVQLTPSQLAGRLQIGANDNRVDKKELARARGISEEAAQDEIKSYDQNGNGAIDDGRELEAYLARSSFALQDINGKPIYIISGVPTEDVPRVDMPEATPPAATGEDLAPPQEVLERDPAGTAGATLSPLEADPEATGSGTLAPATRSAAEERPQLVPTDTPAGARKSEIDRFWDILAGLEEVETRNSRGLPDTFQLPKNVSGARDILGKKRGTFATKAERFVTMRMGQAFVKEQDLIRLFRAAGLKRVNKKILRALFMREGVAYTDGVYLADLNNIMTNRIVSLYFNGVHFAEWLTRRLAKTDMDTAGDYLRMVGKQAAKPGQTAAEGFSDLSPQAATIMTNAMQRTLFDDPDAVEVNWDYVAMYYLEAFFAKAFDSYGLFNRIRLDRIDWKDPAVLSEFLREDFKTKERDGSETRVSLVKKFLVEDILPGRRDLQYLIRVSQGREKVSPRPIDDDKILVPLGGQKPASTTPPPQSEEVLTPVPQPPELTQTKEEIDPATLPDAPPLSTADGE